MPPSDIIPAGSAEDADDVVALMAKIQAGATMGQAAETRLLPLRAALQPLLSPAHIAASAADVQREANLLLQELSAALDRSSGRKGLLPGKLRQLAKGAHMDLHVAVTARLVGSVNTLLQSLDRLEQALAQWDRSETMWRTGVLAALEDLFDVPQERRGRASAAEMPATAADLARLQDQSASASSATMNHVTALAVRVAQAEEQAAAAVEKQSTTELRLQELERRLAQLATGPQAYAPPSAPAPVAPAPQARREAPALSQESSAGEGIDATPIGGSEFDFLVWENLTRGNESAISEEQRKYLEWFSGMGAPILDAGCGRGEFLELLRATGIEAYGIDADGSMVTHCRSKGLSVEQAELFAHLESLENESIGGLFLGQVVEHIPASQLRHLTDLAFAKLIPGGAVVMETINPTCLTTFSGAFYADPTHQKPVHPKALEYFLTASGFGPTSIIFSAPIPPGEKLVPVAEEAPVDPAVKSVILQLNQNLDRLNSVLYGYANYAAAARKPKA